MREPITIVGGGLAGLVLGIALRQKSIPVTLWEAGQYPRHRVCGEFISGRGRDALERLGLLEGLRNAGGIEAGSAAFFSGRRSIQAFDLPEAAFCISRHAADELLAQQFIQLGGTLKLGERWRGDSGSGIVRASGRRAQSELEGWRLFGLKIHARNVRLQADLEMHFVPSGYVGLCRIENGFVNICGLFRSATTVPQLAAKWKSWLCGPENSELNLRLQDAQFDRDSFCSIAAISLKPQKAQNRTECCVGDALTMIPPVTGNGMSMAIESAEIAAGAIEKFYTGSLTWLEAQKQIATACDQRFATRLRWASWMQKAIFSPILCPAALSIAAHSAAFRRSLFLKTR